MTHNGWRAARVVLSGLVAGMAAWSFRPAFTDDAGTAVVLAIAVPVSVATAWGLLAVRFRRAALSWWGTGLAVIGVVTSAVAVTGSGTDVGTGPQRLLTSALPVEGTGPQLAAVAAIAGLTALLGIRSSTRDSARTASLLAPLMCLVLGLSLTAATGPVAAWYPAALVGVGLGVVLMGARPSSAVQLVSGVVIAAVAVIVGTSLTPLVAGSRPPADLQALVSAPVTPKDDTNPMARFLGYHMERTVLDITGTASERVRDLPMVTLTRFDGVVWVPAADYHRASTQLPAANGTASGRQVRLDMHVSTPQAIGWLPRLDHTRSVSVAGLGFDDETGDVLVPRDRPTPEDYTVTGTPTRVDAARLRGDDPVLSTPQRFDLDSGTAGFLTRSVAGRSPGLGQFLALYSALRDGGFRRDGSATPRGGHGLVQIAELLRTGQGTSEQFASAFAVLGRAVGLRTRVVLGFRPRWTGTTFEISGRDVHAWTEVLFAEQGWLPFDPTPAATAGGQGSDEETAAQEDPITQIAPPDHAPVQPPNGTSSAGPAPRRADGEMWWTYVGYGGLASLLLVAAVPLVNCGRRRLAYRTRNPARRAAAAWRDAVESSRAAGTRVGSRHTTGEVLAAMAGPPAALSGSLSLALCELATVADRVAFAPEPISAADADLAWTHANRLRAELPLRRRVLALFDPRPLVRFPARKRR